WRDSLRMAAAHPLAGWGPEVFTAAFPHYESAELARAYPDFAHESPHNIFLDAFTAQGVPGLLLLFGFCAVGFSGAWRLRAGRRGVRALQRAASGGRRASRTAEDPANAWYRLAAIQAAQNDRAGAEQALRAALSAHPHWFKPHSP